MNKKPAWVLIAGVAAVSLGGAGSATAATVIQAPGGLISPGPLSLSGQTTAGGTTGSGVNPTLTLPGSYTYADTFTAPTSDTGSGFGFYDAYVFTVGGSSADSVTSTIKLGSMLSIINLQERLYSATTNDPVPVTGLPASYGTPGGYFAGWTSVLPGGAGEVAVLDALTLNPGTYVLEIRGLADGSGGGSYAGSLNLAPVPLPAGLGLLASGLGALGALRRRRSRGG